MRTVEFVWCCLWAYLDIFGKWLEDQVDNNDYLAGGLIVASFIIFAWMLGAVQIVWLP